MGKIEDDNTRDEARNMMDSETLRLALWRFSHRILTPRSVEAIKQDKGIGKAYRLARESRDLTRKDVADIIGTPNFGRDEVALFEQGLISIRDMQPEVITRIVGIVPEVLDSQPFETIKGDENFKFLLGGKE